MKKNTFNDLSQLSVFALAIFAFFCFGTHDAIGKLVGLSVGFALTAILIQFWRALCAICVVSYQSRWRALIPSNKKVTIYYSSLQALGMLGFYFAVIYLPLVELFIILLIRPVLSSIFTVVFLGERLSKYHVSALVLGILATLVTFQIWNMGSVEHTFNFNGWGVLGGLINVFAMSTRYVLVKKLTQPENILSLIFYSSFSIALVAIPFIEVIDFVITFKIIILTFIAGVLMFVGDYASLVANHSKHIATLVVCQFSILLWVGLYGWFIFSESLNMLSTIGSALILLSGVVIYLGIKKNTYQ